MTLKQINLELLLKIQFSKIINYVIGGRYIILSIADEVDDLNLVGLSKCIHNDKQDDARMHILEIYS